MLFVTVFYVIGLTLNLFSVMAVIRNLIGVCYIFGCEASLMFNRFYFLDQDLKSKKVKVV